MTSPNIQSAKLSQPISKAEAIFKAKCPQCRKGNMYQYPFWEVRKFSQMHKNCPNCGLRFEREPGFFWGATYVSYGISVLVVLICALIITLLFNRPAPIWYVLVATFILIGCIPFTFRAARVVFLYLFGGVKYRKDL